MAKRWFGIRHLVAIAVVWAMIVTNWVVVSQLNASAQLLPQVVVGDLAMSEGHTGTRTMLVPITLNVPAATTQTVTYALAAGTATPGTTSQSTSTADFGPFAGTLAFAAGTVVQYAKITVYGDVRIEGNENVNVNVVAVSSGLEVSRGTGTVHIRDDESTPGAVISIGSISVGEGDSKVRKVSVPVVLSKAAPGASVQLRVVAGSVTGGWSGTGVPPVGVDIGDKSGATQTVTFSTTSVLKFVTVVVAPDMADEPNETFAIVINAVSGASAGANGVGTVLDEDRALTSDPAYGPSDTPVGVVAPGSTLVGCAQATTRIIVTASIHLDPACTYTRGLSIGVSNVTVDCRGANLVRGAIATDSYGVLISALSTTALANITVRNCHVSGFGNNLRVTRSGFKALAIGSEYVNAFSQILIDNNSFNASQNSGVYIDGFVTGVKFTHNSVTNSGAVGIYLEAGSLGSELGFNIVQGNGFKEIINGPQSYTFSGITIYFESTGREGIAVDGSRFNVIHDNRISGDANGGIFLYKNCGEHVSNTGHWVRNYGADGNVIRSNVITAEHNGVWIGSRAAENQHFMDCSDTPLIDQPGGLNRVYLDPAVGNSVEYNYFEGVTNAIRIEGDSSTVRGNWIANGTRGILLGTKHRTTVLAQPITGAVISSNVTTSVAEPFGWIWGKGVTTFTSNVKNGTAAGLAAGSQPDISPYLFVRQFVPAP